VFPPALIGGLLGLAILVLVGVMLWPQKQHDPQAGMAIGCLMIVTLALVVVAGLYGLAIWQQIGWMRDGIGWGVVSVTAYLAVMLAASLDARRLASGASVEAAVRGSRVSDPPLPTRHVRRGDPLEAQRNSRRSRATNSEMGIAPRSPSSRLRTPTVPASMSRSPRTSM